VRLATRLFMTIAVFLVALPVVSYAQNARCVEGPSLRTEAIGGGPIRPTRTAKCLYEFGELIERITKLSIDKDVVDSVETAEKVFGIPDMTTSQNNSHESSYQTFLSGKGGWRLELWVTEGFYPANKGPVRFVPGPHPKRLYGVRDAKLRIFLNITGWTPTPGQTCMPISPLFDALTKAGWKEIPRSGPPSPGDPQLHPQFQYGGKAVGADETQGPCTQSIVLTQNPSKA